MGQFIDRYRDMRNLWEVKNPLYRNKPARKASLEILLQFVKTQVSDADIEFVEKKIGSLRSKYRKKLKKVQASMKSGAAAEDVYVPSLWYYNRMWFLEDQIKARESFSTLQSTLPTTLPSTPAEASEDQPGPSILEEVEEPSWSQEDLSQDEALECASQEEAGVSVSQEVARPSSLTQSQVPSLPLTTKRARKGSNMEEAALCLIKVANVALKTPPDAEEAYGCYVAAKLQQMEEGQRFMCENLIFQALRKGSRGQISENMHFCALAHPPPPATSPPPEPQPPRKAAGKCGGKASGKTRK
ncbi:hypothetical protein AB205_0057550 [Aquarana catesbeiana]|uniref:MADF domain-containing protein n=1 Tax=Aquarana catesbeiana TaxID=8400 RepID=A0A2G9SIL8_AQUCT|nr:hypothetical protein AB205_0057550 [Aquarana catesbeiana]